MNTPKWAVIYQPDDLAFAEVIPFWSETDARIFLEWLPPVIQQNCEVVGTWTPDNFLDFAVSLED
jgi:hypothetical protein